MNADVTLGLEATLAGLSDAWKNADAAAFAECCTEDVDFINLLGMHVRGRRAVTELHEKIFRGPYAGSTVAFTIESVRRVSPTAVLVIAPSRVDLPSGPVKGTVVSIASILFVREEDRWKLANFHNTRREATEAQHLDIMRDAVSS
ncbi:MAG: SgcJ/EcaC family oxidoreductase [Candidatus Tumulicola sp.]